MSIGVQEAKQELPLGSPIAWTAEYRDPLGLHEKSSSVVTLTPGKWFVDYHILSNKQTIYALFVDGAIHSRQHAPAWSEHTTLVNVFVRSELSMKNIGKPVTVSGDDWLDKQKTTELRAVRIGD